MVKEEKSKQEEKTGMAGCVIVCRDLIATSSQAKCLLQYYASNVNDDSCTFFKSTQDIAAETGLSEKTIRSLNTAWVEKKIISIVEHPWWTGKANDYTLHLPVLRKLLKQQQASGKLEAKKLKAKKQGRERTRRWRDKVRILQVAQNVTATVTHLAVTVAERHGDGSRASQ